MKKFIFICVLTIGSMATAAESQAQTMGTSTGIGLAAGWASGFGFAYRQHFDNSWGVQAVVGAFGLQTNAAANLGVQVMHTFSLDRRVRFYGLAGTNLKYIGENRYARCFDCLENQASWNNILMPVIGAGLGFEFHFTRHLSWSIELPISVTTKIENRSFEFVSVLPIPSTALVYQF